jgi:hypothetical protein
MAIATIFAFILPNSPKTVRGHTEQEREWLAWTFGQDQGHQDHSDEITAWRGFEMATADPKTWLLMSTLYCVSIDVQRIPLRQGPHSHKAPLRLALTSLAETRALAPHRRGTGHRFNRQHHRRVNAEHYSAL